MNCDCCGEVTEELADGSEYGYDLVCYDCLEALEIPSED